MKYSKLSFLFFCLFFCSYQFAAKPIEKLSSPDGKLTANFQLKDDGTITYSLKINKNEVIKSSKLGYNIGVAETIPSKEWTIKAGSKRSNKSVWEPVWGKRAIVKDCYNEIVFEMKSGGNNSIQQLMLEARAYNDGIAFRYRIPATVKGTLTPTSELTEYNFAADYTAWFYNFENHNIGPEKLSVTNGKRNPVMTIKAAEDTYMALHEADLAYGEPLVLQSVGGSTTFTVASKPGKMEAGYQSAWRVILCGNSPGALVDSHLIELLNPTPTADYSWVKPGVAVWDWRIDGAQIEGFTYGMNYESWVRMIDFASENNIAHLVLDANWYGPEHQSESNPLDDIKSQAVIKIIQYGKQKGVGVWLYLNDVGGRKYPIEKTLKQYSDWGASGIKYGFMRGSQVEKNAWTRKITALCAHNHLLCNYHDGPVHPYGQMRTFPNAVTREYCQAQLDAHRVFMPSTFVTSVFVNMVAGPIDMNNGMFDLRQGKTTRVDENKPVPSTLVSEAARTLIVFSGATIIPDIPEFYKTYPDLLQFISSQKMPWRESKTLAGEIGKYIVMARQASDNTWLVGVATNEDARELDIPMNFLNSGKFEVTIIQDGDNAHYLTNREVLKVDKKMLQSKDKVHVKLAPGGGACLIIKAIKSN
jgi:alpha-glucosidase